ncbi:hypothetical protein QFZ81_003837 [Paenibacillus sp. V4I9]|nr:hypothetical protein [Paenibacillus sp. V4I9]
MCRLDGNPKAGETVKAEMIGKQIGKVMRIGDWSIKQEGDTIKKIF